MMRRVIAAVVGVLGLAGCETTNQSPRDQITDHRDPKYLPDSLRNQMDAFDRERADAAGERRRAGRP